MAKVNEGQSPHTLESDSNSITQSPFVQAPTTALPELNVINRAAREAGGLGPSAFRSALKQTAQNVVQTQAQQPNKPENLWEPLLQSQEAEAREQRERYETWRAKTPITGVGFFQGAKNLFSRMGARLGITSPHLSSGIDLQSELKEGRQEVKAESVIAQQEASQRKMNQKVGAYESTIGAREERVRAQESKAEARKAKIDAQAAAYERSFDQKTATRTKAPSQGFFNKVGAGISRFLDRVEFSIRLKGTEGLDWVANFAFPHPTTQKVAKAASPSFFYKHPRLRKLVAGTMLATFIGGTAAGCKPRHQNHIPGMPTSSASATPATPPPTPPTEPSAGRPAAAPASTTSPSTGNPPVAKPAPAPAAGTSTGSSKPAPAPKPQAAAKHPSAKPAPAPTPKAPTAAKPETPAPKAGAPAKPAVVPASSAAPKVAKTTPHVETNAEAKARIQAAIAAANQRAADKAESDWENSPARDKAAAPYIAETLKAYAEELKAEEQKAIQEKAVKAVADHRRKLQYIETQAKWIEATARYVYATGVSSTHVDPHNKGSNYSATSCYERTGLTDQFGNPKANCEPNHSKEVLETAKVATLYATSLPKMDEEIAKLEKNPGDEEALHKIQVTNDALTSLANDMTQATFLLENDKAKFDQAIVGDRLATAIQNEAKAQDVLRNLENYLAIRKGISKADTIRIVNERGQGTPFSLTMYETRLAKLQEIIKSPNTRTVAQANAAFDESTRILNEIITIMNYDTHIVAANTPAQPSWSTAGMRTNGNQGNGGNTAMKGF